MQTALIEPLLDLCEQAGAAICEFYQAPGADQFTSKDDDSPLTQADLASHELIQAGLARLTPDWPLLSEESVLPDVEQRLSWTRYWLVDPLDGTKEFLARTGEFTINIALIEGGRPVLGVLHQPLRRVAHVGVPGEGAWRWDLASGQRVALGTNLLQRGAPMRVLTSRRHRGKRLSACLDWLDEHWGPVLRVHSGSALKFCQMADGEGDFYPRFAPCMEWDTAAGMALLQGMGGNVVDLAGQPLRFNQGESLYSPWFLAYADASAPVFQALLQAEVLKADGASGIP